MGIENRLNKLEDQLNITDQVKRAAVIVVTRPHDPELVAMTTGDGRFWYIKPGETSEAFQTRAVAEAKSGSERMIVFCRFSTAAEMTKELAR
jgi:hypothetical protein